MSQDNIIKKIEEIYQSKNKEGKPTGKGFMTHLIRAYFPIDKIHKIWDSPKSNLKCAITGYGVCTIEDAFKALHSEGMDKKLMDHLKSMFKEEGPGVHPLKSELKGKVIGYTGEKTDTVMCLEAVQAFVVWLQNKILSGDTHIQWLMSDMRKSATINSIRERLPDEEDQKKIDRLEKLAKKPQRATMSLGDLATLKELQEKLKLQEEQK